jgi:hypothetical protein
MNVQMESAILRADAVADAGIDGEQIPTLPDEAAALRSASFQQTADILGVHVRTVRKYRNDLGAFQIGRHWRVPYTGIRAFQQRGGCHGS